MQTAKPFDCAQLQKGDRITLISHANVAPGDHPTNATLAVIDVFPSEVSMCLRDAGNEISEEVSFLGMLPAGAGPRIDPFSPQFVPMQIAPATPLLWIEAQETKAHSYDYHYVAIHRNGELIYEAGKKEREAAPPDA